MQGHSYIPEEDDNKEINQEDTWSVIGAFFKEYGLVSQQISSFNHFLNKMIQDIILENSAIIINPRTNYINREVRKLRYEFHFETLSIYRTPVFTERCKVTKLMDPNQARIRNLTYESQLYIDVRQKIIEIEDGEEKVFETKL